jgi:hypothetical protein
VTSTEAPILRVLCSYFFFQRTDMDELAERWGVAGKYSATSGEDVDPDRMRIFADSGGFSAFTTGEAIDRAGYAQWLKRWGHRIEVAANLDDLHDPAVTWDNQRYLEDQGLEVIPVFHMGSDFAWLERYLEAGYRYLALGKMVKRNYGSRVRWAIQCFKMAREAGAVFHGFGLTRPADVWNLPFYSVDSTRWINAFKYAVVDIWRPHEGRFRRMQLFNRKEVYRDAAYLRMLGFDPEPFCHREGYDRHSGAAVAAYSWLGFEQALRRRHHVALPPEAARHLNPPEGNTTGTRLYLAAWDLDLKAANRGLDLYLERL